MGNSAFNFAGANWGNPGAIGAVTPNSARVTALSVGNVVNSAGTYTVAADVVVIRQTTAASVYTLPSAAAFPGRLLAVSTEFAGTVTSASANVIPLGGGAADTAILPATAGAWALLQSDGTNWVIIQQAGGGSSVTIAAFTPSLKFGFNNVGITYTDRSGLYIKSGSIIAFYMFIQLSNKGSSTGFATVHGLPTGIGIETAQTGVVGAWNVLLEIAGNSWPSSAVVSNVATAGGGDNYLTLRSQGVSDLVDITNTHFANTSYLTVRGIVGTTL